MTRYVGRLAGAAVLAASGLLAGSRLRAQEPLVLHPAVTHVVSGGSWSLGDRHGHYRLIVLNSGFERFGARLIIQWLEENGQREIEVCEQRSAAVIGTPWSLGSPAFLADPGATRLTLSGTHTSTGRQTSWDITLGPPGIYAISPHRP